MGRKPNEDKIEEFSGWEPNVRLLPQIVQDELDNVVWPTREEQAHRRETIHRAIIDMVRFGQATRTTTVLHLTGKTKGETIQKEFTFYKIRPNEP